ncbi:DUF4349 domain-containing protein [Acholeplasma hippikon]|uniref:DUF4349 domain-containing protein n=1 Tax=Acholeplasma hippikon TaxID=264636 RepID=A0A449BL14_9MOLU|nr:DUF4349 domain-containing protein [Acholeplasma hippikon]VEU83120.1 Uncharacterised protein [Acholeplasma hippikon]
MKKIILGVIFIFTLFMLIGCSTSGVPADRDDDANVGELAQEVTEPNRKLIFKVTMGVLVDDVEAYVIHIKKALNSDEWIDSESTSLNESRLVIRVKTTRLDNFLDEISNGNKVTQFEKTAQDISKQYVDIETQILNYELQLARLQELYENASLSEMIFINEQISKVQSELARLKGNLSNFDSLVEYSTVTLSVSSNPKDVEKPSFFNQLGNSFMKGVDLLVAAFRGISNLVMFFLPIGVIVSGVTFIGYRISKNKKMKKLLKQQKKDKEKGE